MTPLERALLKALKNPALFSEHIIGRPLRWYQIQPMHAILRSIQQHAGLVFTVMFARQMGKNETSAHLETYLLNRFTLRGGTLIKTAPTYQPQVINSKIRLLQMLNNPLNRFDWRAVDAHRIRLGAAEAIFISGNPEAQVVGLTASLLLEVDEAQDFDETKYTKDFRPMASSTNATTVMYGTAWTGDTTLEHQIAVNRDLEKKDGIQRHFQYDWQTLAAISADYAHFVEQERQRLGEDHPLFRTQYKLQPLTGQNRFLSPAQKAQLQGTHPAQHQPSAGKVYVAGVDLAGEDEESADAALRSAQPKKDSVVVTIAEIDYNQVTEGIDEPQIKVVQHYWWTGHKHRELYATLVDILRHVWHCTRVAVDASGVGAGVASFLQQALGEAVVEQVIFSSTVKSALGFGLLSAVNSGRCKIYHDTDQPESLREFWHEIDATRYDMRGNQQIAWYVPEEEGHDDFSISLALTVHAAAGCLIAPAAGQIKPTPLYQDGRY
jgi:hypothetical protein